MLGLDSGQFNADSKTGGALEHIDRRAPPKIGVPKIREMDFSDLVGDLANLTLEVTQANCSDLSAHRQQWMRWLNEARIQEAKNPRRTNDLAPSPASHHSRILGFLNSELVSEHYSITARIA